MCKVREVYFYTSAVNATLDNKIPLAPPSSSIGTTLTNTAETRNVINILYDSKKNNVGKVIINKNNNTFEKNTGGFVSNATYLFDDGSYVMLLKWVNNSAALPSNQKYVNKAVSTGGKYAGKDVTVILKTDNTLTRKLILEYEK